MKKIMICLVAATFLTNSEIGIREAKAETFSTYREEYRYGMKYGIWYKGGSLQVVNLTKDELEIEVLKKQLQKK